MLAKSPWWAMRPGNFSGLWKPPTKLPMAQPTVPLAGCLGTEGMNLPMRRIQNAIMARGYVAARVLAGPQEKLAQGVVELTLFPGRIHRIGFAPNTDVRATAWNAVPAKPGDLLNLRNIEQALENFKRVPTVQADIQITPAQGPGAEPGQSDLVIQWK